MSKSFVKLIDSAILPAAVMICGKVFGLWFANSVFDLDWKLNTTSSHVASIQLDYFSQGDRIVATSYSHLVMFVFLLIGLSLVLYQAIYLHSSHISPRLLSQLAEKNLMHLIKDSFHVYFEATVWTIFLWITVLLILFHTLLGNIYLWVFILTFVVSSYMTILLLRDVHNEIELAKTNLHTS